MESLEVLILQNLFYNKEYFSSVIYYIEEQVFEDYGAAKIAKIIKYIFDSEHDMATPELVKVALDRAKNLTSEQYKNICDVLDVVKVKPTNVQPLASLIKCTEEYFRQRKIKLSLGAILDKYNNSTKNEISGEYIKAIEDSINYTFDTTPYYNYMNEFEDRLIKYVDQIKKYPFPLAGLNSVTNGGMNAKSLVIAMATTGGGKSIFLCNAAAHLMETGHNVLYVTCEMSVPEIAKRIDANILETKQDDLTKNHFEASALRERMNNYVKDKTLGNLYIKEYPAGCGTASLIRKDIEDIERNNNLKIDVLVVDYINLLSTARYSTKNANTYTLVKAVAEELRAIGQEYDMPIISATQSNRSALNRELKLDMGLEAVSESFGLPQTADFMFNIIESDNADWQAHHYRLIKILKNRWGDPNKKYLKVKLDTAIARFSDVGEPFSDKPNELVRMAAGVENENVRVKGDTRPQRSVEPVENPSHEEVEHIFNRV